MQNTPTAHRAARVLLIVPEAYGADFDAYMSQICESGPFFAEPERLGDVGLLKRHYHCTLPCTSTPAETVMLDVDMLLLLSQPKAIPTILTRSFLDTYGGIVLGVSACSVSNEQVDPAHFSVALLKVLQAELFVPLVEHVRKLGQAGPETPITVVAIRVSDAAYTTVGWELFCMFRNWLATSATFGTFAINAPDVVVDSVQCSHLPWVLLARMIAFNVSLQFAPPKALEAYVLQCSVDENERVKSEQGARNTEFDQRRTTFATHPSPATSAYIDEDVWNFSAVGGGGNQVMDLDNGELPSYDEAPGGQGNSLDALDTGSAGTHSFREQQYGTKSTRRQKDPLQQILDRFNSFDDALMRMEAKQDALMEQIEYIQTQLQDQEEKSEEKTERQTKMLRKISKKLKQHMHDDAEEVDEDGDMVAEITQLEA